MKHSSRRILALLLALSLCIGMMPMSIFADDEPAEPTGEPAATEGVLDPAEGSEGGSDVLEEAAKKEAPVDPEALLKAAPQVDGPEAAKKDVSADGASKEEKTIGDKVDVLNKDDADPVSGNATATDVFPGADGDGDGNNDGNEPQTETKPTPIRFEVKWEKVVKYNKDEQTFDPVSETEYGPEILFFDEKEEEPNHDYDYLADLVSIEIKWTKNDESTTIRGINAGSYSAGLYAVIDEKQLPSEFSVNEKTREYEGKVSLVIEPKPVTIMITGQDITNVYDGKPHTAPFTVEVVEEEEPRVFDVIKDAPVFPKTKLPPINVGEHTNNGTFVFNENFEVTYNEDFHRGVSTITPAPLTIKTNDLRHMYDGAPLTGEMGGEYEAIGLCDASDTIFGHVDTIEDVKWTGSRTEIGVTENGNTADFFLSNSCYADKDHTICNYNITYEFGKLTVFPENEVLVIIRGAKAELQYNGEEQSISGINPVIDNPNYKALYEKDPTIISYQSAIAKGTDAGIYYMGLKASDFTNTRDEYEVTFELEQDGSLTIDPVDAEVHIMPNRETLLYTGEELSIDAYELGVNLAENAPNYDLSKVKSEYPTTIKGTAIGIYKEKLDMSGFSNTDKNFNVTFVMDGNEAYLRIVAPTVYVTVKGTMFETPYSGEEQTLSFEDGKAVLNGEEAESPLYTVVKVEKDKDKDGNEIEVDFDAENLYLRRDPAAVSGTEGGEYVSANWASLLAYSDPTVNVQFGKTGDLGLKILPEAVEPTTLTVAIEDVTAVYGNEPEFKVSFEGLPEGAAEPKCVLKVFDADGEQVKFPYSVGTYTIKYSEAPTTKGSAKAETEYVIANPDVTATLTVTKRPVTVKIDGARESWSYNTPEYPIEHVVKGYTVTIEDDLYTEKDFTFSGEAIVKGTDIGEYPMGLKKTDFTNINSNFEVEFIVKDGLLKVFANGSGPSIRVRTLEGTFTFNGESYDPQLEIVSIPEGYSLDYVRLMYRDMNKPNARLTDTPPVNAGSYRVTIGGETGDVIISDPDGCVVHAWSLSLNSHADGHYGDFTITPCPIKVTLTGNTAVMRFGNGHQSLQVKGFTTDVDYGNYQVNEEYKFDETKDLAYNSINVIAGPYDGVNPQYSGNNPSALGNDLDADEDHIITFPMHMIAGEGEDPIFVNKNTNYDVTFNIINGWLEVHRDTDYILPDIHFYFENAQEEYDAGLKYREYVVYDGKEHVFLPNYRAYVFERSDTYPYAQTYLESYDAVSKPLTAEDVLSGNLEQRFEIPGKMADGTDTTFTYVLNPKFTVLKRTDAGGENDCHRIEFNTLSSADGSFKVLDKNGNDITTFFSGNTMYTHDVYLIVTKAELEVEINPDLVKNYGEPDPDINTWVTVKNAPEGFDPVRDLDVWRDRGEEAFTTQFDEETGEVIKRSQPGIYPIHVSFPVQFHPWNPGDMEEQKVEEAKKAMRRVVAEESAAHESESAHVIVTQTTNWGNNYTIKITNEDKAFLTINPLPLTITAKSYEKDYLTNDPSPLEAIVEGLYPGEVIPEGAYTVGPRKAHENGEREVPGTYVIPIIDNFKNEALFDYEGEDQLLPFIPADQEFPGTAVEKDYEEVKDYLEEVLMEEVSAAKKESATRSSATESVAEEARPVQNLIERIDSIERVNEEEAEQPYHPGDAISEEADELVEVVAQNSSGRFLPENYVITLKDGELVITGSVLYHSNYKSIEGIGEVEEAADYPDAVTSGSYTAVSVTEAGFANSEGIFEYNGVKYKFVCWTDKDGKELGSSFDFTDNGVQPASGNGQNEVAPAGEATTNSRMTLVAAASSSADGTADLELYAKWEPAEDETPVHVVWMDEPNADGTDGETLYEGNYAETPAADEYNELSGKDNPTKPEDDDNTYEFSGWSDPITREDGTIVYTAQYTATPKNPTNPGGTNPRPKTDDPTEEDPTEIDDGDTPLAGYEEPEEDAEEVSNNETPLAGFEVDPEEDDEIAEEATPFSPYTGDDRNTVVWGIVSILSLLGIVLVARKRREE